MPKKIKILLVVLAVLLIAGIVVCCIKGCSNSGENEPSKDDNSSEEWIQPGGLPTEIEEEGNRTDNDNTITVDELLGNDGTDTSDDKGDESSKPHDDISTSGEDDTGSSNSNNSSTDDTSSTPSTSSSDDTSGDATSSDNNSSDTSSDNSSQTSSAATGSDIAGSKDDETGYSKGWIN